MATQITALPTPPSRQDPANFSTRADTFLGQLPTFATEANALAVFAETKASEAADQVTLAANQVTLAANQVMLAQQEVALATEQADSAEASAFIASGAANYKGDYSPSTTYTIGQSVSYNGSRFIAKKTNLNITPNDGVDWLRLPSTEIIRDQRTSNVLLTASDLGKLIDITSGTFTQTFAAATTLGNGWYCYIRNSGTGDITLDPNASETIDGLTSYVMYPGEVRLIQCDGTALRSVVLSAFYKTFTASGTFIKPPGYSLFEAMLWGAGGGGAKDSTTTANTMGGGGGACSIIAVKQELLSASETVTIGAGGTGASTNTTAGTSGGNSVFFGVTSVGGGLGRLDGFGNGGAAYAYNSSTVNPIFSAAASTSTDGYLAYMGGGASPRATTNSCKTVYGGAGGGAVNASNVEVPSQGSFYGGAGGSASISSSGTDGVAPGGGGGATRTGAKAGNGASGALRIWGII